MVLESIGMAGMAGFERPELLLLLALSLPSIYFAWKTQSKEKRIVSLLHGTVIAVLVVAAASPFIVTQQDVSKQPEVTILEDNSRSTDLLEKKEIDLGEVEVNRKTIDSGNSSDLRDGIIRNTEPNRAYLLASDGQTSQSIDSLGERLRNQNSTLNLLKFETEEDSSVAVKGPSSTVPGAQNRFTVEVHSTQEEVPKPQVELDGSSVELEREPGARWSFTETFDNKGTHNIKASIDSNDRFDSNNRFYKTVKVREKPEILVLGGRGTLGNELSKFYDITYRDSLPQDLSDYYTVVAKEEWNGQLEGYLAEGNGLVYTGSHENEKEVLPTKPIPEEQQSEGAKIMLVIDISLSTEEGESIKESKKIAYSLVDRMGYNNRVGAVAYNTNSYLVSKPEPLANHRADLKSKISSLETGGNSFHHLGLKGAKQAINGTGNVILITDGKISNYGRNVNTGSKSRRIASSLEARLLTVGVGDSNSDFLEDLSDRGDGFYLDASNSGRLNFMFEGGGAAGGSEGIIAVNPHHFITEGLGELDARVAGYEPVEAKPAGQLLVTGTSGKPLLTSWRYGLGRVADFSGGTSELGEVLERDPRLVTRSVSWTVGQPLRKQDRWVKIEDGRRNEKVEVEASYDLNGLRRQGDDLYTGELSPEEVGFHSFNGFIYGYSYSQEIEKVGYSQEMIEEVEDSGGNVYSPDSEQEIINDIQHFSNREVKTRKSLADYLLALALLIFLAEVGYRKTNGKK